MKRNIKRILATGALAASLTALAAGQASAANTTGVINITGSVASKCSVVTTPAPPGGADFGTTVNLGELADADGHLRSDIQSSTAIGALDNGFTLTCTGSNAGVTVDATPLLGPGTAPSGYANRIDYTANAHFLLVSPPASNSTLDVTDTSDVSGSTGGSFGASNFLQSTANNVVITAYSFHTASTATDILLSGAYSATITVVITPS